MTTAGKAQDEEPSVRERVTLWREHGGLQPGKTVRSDNHPFRSFQHLAGVKQQLSCLSRAREHLAPGGKFVLDIFDPDLELLTDYGRAAEFGEEPPFPMPDGTMVTVSYRNPSVDTVNQIIHCEMIFKWDTPEGNPIAWCRSS